MLQDAQRLLEKAEQAATGGDLSSADKLLRDAARIQEAELGPLHPDLVNTLNNLAIVAEKTGRPDDAETFYRRAAAIASASLPADHPMVAESRRNLEDFCRERLGLTGAHGAAPESQSPPATPHRLSRALAWVVIGALALAIVVAGLVRRSSSSRDASNTTPVAAPVAPSVSPPVATQPSEPALPPKIEPPAVVPPTVAQPKAVPRAGDRAVVTNKPRSTPSSSTVGLVSAQLCQPFSISGDRWRCDPPRDPAAAGKIVCYTRVRSPRDTVVVHRWYRENILQQAVKLPVRANASEGYRTYSRQTVDAAGNWRVEVRSADGELLQELRFTVR